MVSTSFYVGLMCFRCDNQGYQCEHMNGLVMGDKNTTEPADLVCQYCGSHKNPAKEDCTGCGSRQFHAGGRT